MECRQAEQAILESADNLPAGVQNHVQTCPCCQAFAAAQQHLLTLEGHPAPSPALDQAVLRRAHDLLGHCGRSRRNPPLMMAAGWLAAAAALVAVFALSAFLRHAETPSSVAVASPAPVSSTVTATDDSMTWESADLDLVVMAQELDLAFAQLDAKEEPASRAAAADLTESNPGSLSIGGLDNALLELECDLYFGMQQFSAGG